MKTFKAAILSALFVLAAFGQTTTTQTTLSSAVAGLPTPDQVINVASATGITALGNLGQIATVIVIDREAMTVQSVSSTQITVERGQLGTQVRAHASGAIVYAGPPQGNFQAVEHSGACTAANIPYLPQIVLPSGNVYDCPTSGPNNGLWAIKAQAVGNNYTDGAFFVPAGAGCMEAASASAGTGDGTIVLDGSVPALKGAATAAAHLVFTCTFQVPGTRLTSTKGITLTDITYLYGPQTTAPTSMVASTFASFTAPAPGTSETAASATLVTAGGSLTQTPVVASANLTAQSAGKYFSEKVSFGTPVAVNTDLQTFVFTFELDQSAGATTVVTTPGFWVHYTSSPN